MKQKSQTELEITWLSAQEGCLTFTCCRFWYVHRCTSLCLTIMQYAGDGFDVLSLSWLFCFLLLLQEKHQQRSLQLSGEQEVEMAIMTMVEIFWQEWVLEVRCVVVQATNPNPNWMNYSAKMHLSVKVNFILSVLHNWDECSCFYYMSQKLLVTFAAVMV